MKQQLILVENKKALKGNLKLKIIVIYRRVKNMKIKKEKTLEEIAEEKREELYENEMEYYLDHYIEIEDI